MSDISVQGQIGLGTTGLNLLQTAKETLSLCTSDGVTSTVLTFLDAFGARFAVSPHLCARVRDVCIKEQSTVLGKLKVAVGYRKGDAAAVLASSSAGLSSVAFIIVATEMFKNEDMAWMMAEMADGMIPSSITPPSPREINVCIDTIHHRCPDFDFCSHYAKTVMAIRRTRMAKGHAEVFDNLTRPPSAEDAIPLLRSILSCLHDDRVMLYIKGSESLGIIAAAASWWFPASMQISSEEMVIWPCDAAEVRCTIHVSVGCKTEWWCESSISSLSDLLSGKLPPLGHDRSPDEIWPDGSLVHPISGFVRGALGSLGFAEGLECERACSLVAKLAYRLAESLHVRSEQGGLSKPFLEYIGSPPASLQHILRSIAVTCGTALSRDDRRDFVLVQELESLAVNHVAGVFSSICRCRRCQKSGTKSWYQSGNADCPFKWLRGYLGELVLKVFLHFMIDSDFDFRMTIGSNIPELRGILPTLSAVWAGQARAIESSALYGCIAASLLVPWPEKTALLGSSRYGTCMYVASAFWPAFEQGSLVRIRIVHGAFIHKERYFEGLLAGRNQGRQNRADQERQPTNHELLKAGANLDDNPYGCVRDSRFTVRELIHDLQISLTINASSGWERQIDLARAVDRARLVHYVDSCAHSRKAALHPRHEHLQIVRTSIATIPFISATNCLISVNGDHEACLYACDSERCLVVTTGSCVNCALDYIIRLNKAQKYLIVMFQ